MEDQANSVKMLPGIASGHYQKSTHISLDSGLAQDVKVVQMRQVLDQHRHYKKEKNALKHLSSLERGVIIAGRTDSVKTRLPKAERSISVTKGIISDHSAVAAFKKRYTILQLRKSSGKKAFYKKLRERRSSQ